jgi:hypothetical protein
MPRHRNELTFLAEQIKDLIREIVKQIIRDIQLDQIRKPADRRGNFDEEVGAQREHSDVVEVEDGARHAPEGVCAKEEF